MRFQIILGLKRPILIFFNLLSAVFGHFRDIFAKPPCTSTTDLSTPPLHQHSTPDLERLTSNHSDPLVRVRVFQKPRARYINIQPAPTSTNQLSTSPLKNLILDITNINKAPTSFSDRFPLAMSPRKNSSSKNRNQ